MLLRCCTCVTFFVTIDDCFSRIAMPGETTLLIETRWITTYLKMYVIYPKFEHPDIWSLIIFLFRAKSLSVAR